MVKQESAHQQPSNERVWSACRLPDTCQYVYSIWYTPHTDTAPDLLKKCICPSSSLCATLSFPPSLSLNQKKRHCLSLPLVFRVHVRIHIHRHTSTVRAQIRNHLHPQRLKRTHIHNHTHTRIDCLLLLWWLRAVKTPLLSLPLSPKQLDWACLCRFTETAVYPPSFFLSSHSPLQFASWFCFLELFSPCPHTF